MTYKQIEACREARLWIGQIIVPAVTTAGLLYASNSKVKSFVDEKVETAKYKWKTRKLKVVK